MVEKKHVKCILDNYIGTKSREDQFVRLVLYNLGIKIYIQELEKNIN